MNKYLKVVIIFFPPMVIAVVFATKPAAAAVGLAGIKARVIDDSGTYYNQLVTYNAWQLNHRTGDNTFVWPTQAMGIGTPADRNCNTRYSQFGYEQPGGSYARFWNWDDSTFRSSVDLYTNDTTGTALSGHNIDYGMFCSCGDAKVVVSIPANYKFDYATSDGYFVYPTETSPDGNPVFYLTVYNNYDIGLDVYIKPVTSSTFNLTTVPSPTAGGTTTGDGSGYAAGYVANIKATAASGWTFSSWSTSDGGSFGNANSYSTTYTMPSKDAIVTATFTEDGGSPSATPETHAYVDGVEVTNQTIDGPVNEVYWVDSLRVSNATSVSGSFRIYNDSYAYWLVDDPAQSFSGYSNGLNTTYYHYENTSDKSGKICEYQYMEPIVGATLSASTSSACVTISSGGGNTVTAINSAYPTSVTAGENVTFYPSISYSISSGSATGSWAVYYNWGGAGAYYLDYGGSHAPTGTFTATAYGVTMYDSNGSYVSSLTRPYPTTSTDSGNSVYYRLEISSSDATVSNSQADASASVGGGSSNTVSAINSAYPTSVTAGQEVTFYPSISSSISSGSASGYWNVYYKWGGAGAYNYEKGGSFTATSYGVSMYDSYGWTVYSLARTYPTTSTDSGNSVYYRLEISSSDATVSNSQADASASVSGGGNTHTLTIAVSPAGGGTTTPSIGAYPGYHSGDTVNITRTANSGYTLSSWMAGGGSFSNVTGNSVTYTMPDEDDTVTAHFTYSPLTTVVPTSTAPLYAEQNETIPFVHSISGSATLFTANYTIYRKTYVYTNAPITPAPAGAIPPLPYEQGTGTATVPAAGPNPYTVTNPLSPAATGSTPVGSQICEYLYITSGTVTATNPSRACVIIVNRPYVKFFGGDVDFCSGNGNVYTAARKDAANNYLGSSAQYALFAYGVVGGVNPDKHGFYSRSGEFDGTPTSPSPKQVTFANVDVADIFGGNWSPSAPSACTNYFNELNVTPVAPSSPLPGSTINPGENITKAYTGSVTITGNITYGTSPAWTKDNIPSYRLIVKGDIFITSGVTQLDGFYFATKRDDGTGGNIYTCTSGSSTTFPGYGTCNSKLTVNGAMQAMGAIKYWRAGGTLTAASTAENTTPTSSNAAESFIISPEMYLSNWLGAGAVNSFSGRAQSIRNLPPVF